MKILDQENKALASVKSRSIAYFIDIIVIMISSALLLSATPAAKEFVSAFSEQNFAELAKLAEAGAGVRGAGVSGRMANSGAAGGVSGAATDGDSAPDSSNLVFATQSRGDFGVRASGVDRSSGSPGRELASDGQKHPRERAKTDSADASIQISLLSAIISNFIMSALIVYLLTQIVYYTVFLATSGATVGCMLTRIRHLNASDLGAASWPAAACKAVVLALANTLTNGLILLLFLADARRQTLADKIINQVVICED